MSNRTHWEHVYETKQDDEVSWTQSDPQFSLSLIQEVCQNGAVIDIGGGSSRLAGRLAGIGYTVTVVDIAEAALERARREVVSPDVDRIQWIQADVTRQPMLRKFDVWHDRAVFHFLTDPADRSAYIALLTATIPVGGYAIIATFALDGPERCSGLTVQRYDGEALGKTLGSAFIRMKTIPEIHQTPWGASQFFQYSVFKRIV